MNRARVPPAHPFDRSARSSWWALAIVLATWVLAAWITSRTTLFDRDEPRFARAAVEMAHGSNWLFPTFRGELRPDKPILIYWLMALAVRAFGAREAIVRCASPIALAASVWLVHRVGRTLFDARTGLVAAVVLALSPLALLEGTIATTDACLLLLTACSTWIAMRAVLGRARAGAFVPLGIALGLGLLLKGPVALAIPMLAACTTAWLARPIMRTGVRTIAAAAIVGVLIFLAWGIPANAATGGRFARMGLVHHVLDRSVSPMEGHGGNYLASLPFYLPVVALGLLPLSLFLPGAIACLVRVEVLGRSARAVLIGWTVPCLVLMTLVATKLPHYVLPMWPGLALALAACIERAESGVLGAVEMRWLRRGAWLFGVLACAWIAAIVVAPHALDLHDATTPFAVLAALWAVSAIGGLTLFVRGRYRRAAIALAIGSVLAWTWTALAVLPRVETAKATPRIARAVNASTPSDAAIATFRFHEPSLDFYLGLRAVTELSTADELREWTRAHASSSVLVTTRRELDTALDESERAAWREIASERGFDFSKGKPTELVALAR